MPVLSNTGSRLHRTGQFAMWASSYANVTWWTSAFDHFRKVFLFDADSEFCASNNLRIKLFRGCSYVTNFSFKRLLDQNLLAKKILSGMRADTSKPDVIFCALPPVEIAGAVVEYARENKIPVVLDMRDMWPDIFVDHVPKLLRSIASIALSPLFLQARSTLRKATAITGITDSFVQWGLTKADRIKTKFDVSFPFSYPSVSFELEKISVANRFWDSIGVRQGDSVFTVCFFGTLGRQFDFQTVFRAFSYLKGRARLVVCGVGDKSADIQNMAKGMDNILFPGWVDASKIHSLMRRSSAGLDPLPDRYDFIASINNKAIEYLSAGLPVISSPQKGELYDFLRKNACGVSFTPGDCRGLADLISSLISNPNEVKEMSDAATRCFMSNFESNAVHSRMLKYLQSIVSEPY